MKHYKESSDMTEKVTKHLNLDEIQTQKKYLLHSCTTLSLNDIFRIC